MRGMMFAVLGGFLVAACSGPEARTEAPSSMEETPAEETRSEELPPDQATDDAVAGSSCDSDADCAVHVPCCTCPGVPLVLHVEDVRANQRSCAVRSCMACDRPYEGPTPVAACRDGACVDARP